MAGPIFGLALFSVALWVLHRELGTYRYADVVRAIEVLPASRVVLALVLTAANYLVLTAYDGIALRVIGRPLPHARVAFASFLSYAFSQGLGFPLLTGAPVRFRLYSLWGLTAIEIAQVIAFSSLTLFLGLFTVAGGIFVLRAVPVPEAVHLPIGSTRPLGTVLLMGVLGYLLWHAMRKRAITIGAWEFPIPSPRTSLLQIGVSSLDWVLAGAVLYVLLPPAAALPFLPVLEVFLLAQMAGLISQIPGGLGVFEAVVLLLLPAAVPQAAIAASLVAYRMVYYVLPLATAAVLLGVHEALQRGEGVRRATRLAGQWLSVLAPQVLALTTFLAGALLLLSGATPALSGRMAWLSRLLPLPIIELSHFLASIIGVLLLVLAQGIRRRLDAAYHLTVALLVAGIVFSLLKGLDYEEATALLVMLGVLVSARGEFSRRTSLLSEPFTIEWAAATAIVLLGTIWAGVFAYKHVEYTGDLWWRFALRGDAPRFLRATVGVLATLVFIAALRLLRPAGPMRASPRAAELERAAAIARTSPDTRAWLALLGDKELLFSDAGDAFLMYGVEGRSWIALGDPIGAEAERTELAWRFREMVDRHDGWPVFYQVRTENLPLYLDLGLTLLKLGEAARVALAEFSLEGSGRKGLRHTATRLDREGVTFEVASGVPSDALLAELRQVSEAWLAAKGSHEKGFSLGWFHADYLRQTPLALVRHEGGIVAFANVWPGGDRNELSVDLMRYRPGAVESVMDFLLIRLMLWGREQGFRWFNLGMAPLSGMESRRLAPLWSRIADVAYRHGDPFYSFQGLRQYKQKFDPVWEPRYLACRSGLALPRILTNVATLISGAAAEPLPATGAAGRGAGT